MIEIIVKGAIGSGKSAIARAIADFLSNGLVTPRQVFLSDNVTLDKNKARQLAKEAGANVLIRTKQIY